MMLCVMNKLFVFIAYLLLEELPGLDLFALCFLG